MGGICCCQNNKSELDEYDENRPIIDGNSRIGINDDAEYGSLSGNNGYAIGVSNGGRQGQSYENSQAQLYTRVFNQLNQKSIDISVIEKTGELVDLNERESNIYKRLNSVYDTVDVPANRPTINIYRDPNHRMSNEPIPMEDYQLITTIANQTAAAIEYDFVIRNAQPFVIKFDD